MTRFGPLSPGCARRISAESDTLLRMKAVRVHEFGGPEVLKLENVAEPEPGDGQVLVRVRGAGINPVDTYIRSGTYAFRPELPFTPGFDGAGIVEGTGQRVYFGGTVTGSCAELAVCDSVNLYPLPENVSFAEGAAIAVPYGTAHRALFARAKAQPGESVLVHGASGGVGTAAVQLARGAGMTVIGTGGTAGGRELVTREGAHHVLDHGASGYMDTVMELTDGTGVDVILEMLANVNLGKDLRVLSRGGRVVVIGSRGTVEINPRDAMAREASIIGMVLLSASPEELQATHRSIYAGLENSSLRPIVGTKLSLDDVVEAHRKVMEPGARGNIVLGID